MKTNFLRSTVMATSLILALTACGEKAQVKKADGTEGKIEVTTPPKGSNEDLTVTVDAKPVVDASGLADAAEQLVGPYSFMLADKVFDAALEKDANNMKAQFYKALLKRMMIFKGIATRVRPVIKTNGNIAQLDKSVKDFPESALKTFLLEGKEDLQKPSNIITILAEYKNAVNDFRKFTKLHADLELTLNLNPLLFQKQITEEATDACSVIANPDKSVTVSCDYSKAAQKKINSADMVVLSQMAAGEVLYLSMYTAYDVDALADLAADKSLEGKSAEQILARLKSMPTVAGLRKDQSLSTIPTLGADFVAAYQWAMKYQGNLCAKGEGKKNRPGFLVNQGVCVQHSTEADQSIAMLNAALSSAISMPVRNARGEEVSQIRVNVAGFLKNPPQDLKMLLPETVNAEGKVTSFGPDKTLGGLFPDGDVERLTVK
ncbi:MAG: hypothetical protein H7326_10970 [Bdellovibrionaceae bacterium]|nr:hypothetical protein [Pseudobdellovibrionaceae bacterium]